MSIAQPRRVRRTPEEARRVILDAAEVIARRAGPGGLRLMDVAAEAGVSHPTILHHFEGREGLTQALNRRTLDQLGDRLREQIERPDGTMADMIGDAFATYRGGLAERLAWMFQADAAAQPAPAEPGLFEDMAKRLHNLRGDIGPPDQRPDFSDSRAVVHLITIAAFGEAIIGQRLRHVQDAAGDAAFRDTFESWFIKLISRHIHAH